MVTFHERAAVPPYQGFAIQILSKPVGCGIGNIHEYGLGLLYSGLVESDRGTNYTRAVAWGHCFPFWLRARMGQLRAQKGDSAAPQEIVVAKHLADEKKTCSTWRQYQLAVDEI
jgi:hypothetical protein